MDLPAHPSASVASLRHARVSIGRESASYFLGVDGGGTGCRARLSDAAGRVLGEGRAGPANLGLGADAAAASVLAAAGSAAAQAGLDDTIWPRTVAGLGLAGANVGELRDAFLDVRLPFGLARVASDAETACLGAHGDREGGILIVGTGSQGVAHVRGTFLTVGGWGFAVSDQASGASLGRAALRHALCAHEGVAPASPLTRVLMQAFDGDPERLSDWSLHARPGDYGRFAPAVFAAADAGDEVARGLVCETAREAGSLLDRLQELGASRLCLMGGLAAPLRPWLPSRVQAMLCAPRGDALDGGLTLAARDATAAA